MVVELCKIVTFEDTTMKERRRERGLHERERELDREKKVTLLLVAAPRLVKVAVLSFSVHNEAAAPRLKSSL